MLKKNALKRIIRSTLALFILLLICLLSKDNTNTITHVEYTNEITIPIYAIDHNNYVSRTTLINSDKDSISYIICALTIKSEASEYLNIGFKPIIPENTRLLDYSLENGILKLNFSKELLNITKEKENMLIEAIVYSLCELEKVDKIILFVDGQILDYLPSGKKLNYPIDKSIGINKIYDINDFKNTIQTTTYFIGKYNNSLYYIPITKISTEDMSPVEVIVKELKITPIYETNLISYLNASYELKDYEILANSINLSFDNSKIAGIYDNETLEKVKYTLALSLRDTYNINDISINFD